ncbi:MAG: PQQ-binding-like beta-propeller repeat protein [Bacteroidales bacterium]|nr:PQQ-binding-like beta-propeller repeat protein [Bacteroidales bacterium]
MKKITYLLIVLGLFSFFACEDEGNDNPENQSEKIELDVVWENTVYDDTLLAMYFPARFTGDYVVFCSKGHYYSDQGILVNPGFAVYHKETGERHPAWDHEPDIDIIEPWAYLSDFEVGGKDRDILSIQSPVDYKFMTWDLNTGNKLWEKALSDDYLRYFSSYGSYFFLTRRAPGTGDWAELIALNAKTGVEKVILHEDAPVNEEIKFFPPSATTLSNGDTLLVFSKRKNKGAESFVYAFNLTADSLVWKADNISGAIPANEGIIADGYYIFQGYHLVSCFDIQTGNLLWSDEPVANINDNLTGRKNLYFGGKLLVNNQYGELFCYDVSSGAILWENKESMLYPAMHEIMSYYEDRIYLYAGYNSSLPEKDRNALRCISANTGEVLWTTNGPEEARFESGLNVDRSSGYLYITNSISAFCIDLNQDPLAGK